MNGHYGRAADNMAEHGKTSNWLMVSRPNPTARLCLICLPYAGGSAATYASWQRYFGTTIEVVAVQPPGRANRLLESPISNMPALIGALFPQLLAKLARSYVLFGHSLGSRVGFELMRRAHQLGLHLPLHFIASASLAPHVAVPKPPSYQLPDEQFKAQLRELNGTPEEVLASEELMELCLPMLRADFEISDTHVTPVERRYQCPASLFVGRDDADVPAAAAADWQEHFADGVATAEFPGGHFFVETHPAPVLKQLADIIDTALASPQRSAVSVPQ
jgi:medium-chain acyl-[acyl-carrier-protein] hydrolase